MLWSVDLSPIARSRRGGEECAAVIIMVIPPWSMKFCERAFSNRNLESELERVYDLRKRYSTGLCRIFNVSDDCIIVRPCTVPQLVKFEMLVLCSVRMRVNEKSNLSTEAERAPVLQPLPGARYYYRDFDWPNGRQDARR